MKKRLVAGLAAVLLVVGMFGVANATPAYDFASPPNAYTNGSWAFGQMFTVGSENITVDALGYYDDLGNGFLSSHEVGIFSEAGSLLVSTTVTTTDTLIDDFRYRDIIDIVLMAGQQYRIVGVSLLDNYNYSALGTADPRIIENGYAYVRGTTLQIGNDFTGPGVLWAANFNIRESGSSVPEPSTMLLLGSCLLGLVGMMNRRRKA